MLLRFAKILIIATALCFVALRASADTAGKIAYVDMQKAIQETAAGKKAKADIEKQFSDKRTELQKKEADLKKMDGDLQKKAASMSEEARTKQMQELQTDAMKFQREVSESQTSLQKTQAELTRPILEGLQKAVDKVAKAGGYSMILEKGEQSVLYARSDLDVTNEVVKTFEADKPAAK